MTFQEACIILGVDGGSITPDKAAHAYRTLMRSCHPDIHGEEGLGETQRLNEAWVLVRSQLGMNKGGRGAPDAAPLNHSEVSISLDKLLRREAIGDEACGTCPVCRGTGMSPEPAACTTCEGTGVEWYTVGQMRTMVRCGTCKGAGVIHAPCPRCHGHAVSGLGENDILPACTRDGDILNYPKGTIRVTVKKSPGVSVRGDDLYITHYAPYRKLVEGGDIEVAAPDRRRAVISLQEGTCDGCLHRIAGRGMWLSETSRGHLFVRVLVDVPRPVTKKPLNLLSKRKR